MFERKSSGLRGSDEAQARQGLFIVDPIILCRPFLRVEELSALVIANGRGRDASSSC